MKIDFSAGLTTLDGKQLPNGPGENEPGLCLHDVAVTALLAMSEGQGPAPAGDEKVRRYRLARKLFNASKVELTPEDVVLLKSLIGQIYGPLVVGQVWDLLDPAPP